jgi:FAD/FMN-containing dehydrogenase
VSPELLAALRAVVGDRHVATDPERTAAHAREWTGRFSGVADVVVAPADTAQVAGVLRACQARGVAVVPQGGNTGLVGGSVPQAGQVVADLRRLTDLTIDAVGRVAMAGAGVTIAALGQAAAAVGLRYAVDLASRDSATVGGTVATNAGGLRVVRFGATRAQLLGIEAVLADGSMVAHTPGFGRDNTGYHLPSLLCGSEGTLAVVTATQLRLLPAAPSRTVALLALASVPRAVHAATALGAHPFVEAVELFTARGVALVCEVAGLAPPFPRPHAAYVLVEARATAGLDDGLLGLVETLRADDVAVGLDAADAARLWAFRERHTDAISTLGPVHKLDVTLPQDRLGQFLEELPTAIAGPYPHAQVWLFGHAGDGNVHVNVTGVEAGDDTLDDLVLRRVAADGGSISSEHGVGRAKAPWLSLSRSPVELALFDRLKAAFDPTGILNPGVLRPPTGPAAPSPR